MVIVVVGIEEEMMEGKMVEELVVVAALKCNQGADFATGWPPLALAGRRRKIMKEREKERGCV